MVRPVTGPTQSLALRLLGFLVSTVAVGLTLHAVISWRSSRAEFLSYVRSGAAQYSDLIVRATHDGMLLHRLDEVQDTLQRLVSGDAVDAIRIYDKRGVVVLSGTPSELGDAVDSESPTCTSCHSESTVRTEASLERSALAQNARQSEVLRHLTVIRNDTSCAGANCHASPADRPVLGVLDVEMSMEPMRAALRSEQRRLVATAAGLIVLLSVGSALYVRKHVREPVRRLVEGTKRIAEGDLKTRILVQGSHELSQLGNSFNQMAAELGDARLELQSWSQNLEVKVEAKTAELQRVQQAVLQMERMASLGKISATVAHELNNPIGGMLNYARLVQRELASQPLSEQGRQDSLRYLERIQAECVRCGRIVSDLLVFARGHGAQMAPSSLRDIVDRSLGLLQHHLQMHAVSLQYPPFVGDDRLVCDADQIQQALLALLVNAVEAMSSESSDERKLTVIISGNLEHVGCDIADTGVGIAAETLPHVFEPFFSTKTDSSGVGLGLAVVYGIVQRHGGSVEIESEVGRGTQVRLRLPRTPVATAGLAAAVDSKLLV